MTKLKIGDMKHGLTSDRPKMTLLCSDAAIYQVRATEYGADKYARANFYGPAPDGVTPVDRFLGYVDATIRHLMAISQAINVAKGTGGDQVAACATTDDKASGGFPPSLLPHAAHVLASMAIGIECAIQDGLLPADPGQPWKAHPLYAEVLARRGKGAGSGLPQKDDPDAERRRVESGYNMPNVTYDPSALVIPMVPKLPVGEGKRQFKGRENDDYKAREQALNGYTQCSDPTCCPQNNGLGRGVE